MDYLKKYFLIVLFSGLLLIPFINSNTGFWEFDRKDENRVFTDLVQLDIYRLDKFPKHFESYLQDNFSFRTPLLSLYHHLKFTVHKYRKTHRRAKSYLPIYCKQKIYLFY